MARIPLPTIRSMRHRRALFVGLAVAFVALSSAVIALRFVSRDLGPLPASALMPPARF